jgi:two-component system, OmpR family, sensor kinase
MKKNIFNRHSIFFTINVALIISILVITLSFGVLYNISMKKENHLVKRKAVNISRMILREQHKNNLSIDDDFKQYLKQLNYILIDNKKMKQNFLIQKDIQPLMEIQLGKNVIRLYRNDGKRFITIFTQKKLFLIEDQNQNESDQNWLVSIFLLILFILTLLYIMIIQKLRPLQTLHQNIQKLSHEEFDIECSSNKKDEISLLLNELHATVLTLKKIKESRNIFIRNIMHELKTPIAKGKFLSELEHNPKNNDKLKTVFLRLESLIQEFASIEELISTKKALTLKEYFLEDIIDESLDLLMIDETLVQKEYDPHIKLTVDFKLFTIAIKNLLDNGIKYSSNNSITIVNQNNNIVFINQGEELQYQLEQYFEPFFKGKNSKSNESFGLGLYIIHHILKAHNFILQYEYKEGQNHFMISKR